MKKVYHKFLKGVLDTELPKVCPGFEPFTVRIKADEKSKSTLQAGEKVFRRVVDDGLWLFLSIIPHQSQERWMLEVGWSTTGRFPFDISRPTTVESGSDHREFSRQECMIDFGDLFRLRHPNDLAHIGWNVWQCSVSHKHPRFKEIFITEDMMPVSDELAQHRVSQAFSKFAEDLRELVLPYLEKREKAYRQQAGTLAKHA